MMRAGRLLLAACLAAAGEAVAAPGDVIRFALPGWVELELVEVGGVSHLPLEYLYTGKNRENVSRVTAPRYWVGRFEVMQKQYEAVMGENPSPERSDDRMPVTCVKWQDAVDFCDRLNYVCQGQIPSGCRFDLPTVVEWAHAFGAGTTNVFRYSGSDDVGKVAWHGIGSQNGTVRFETLHLPGLKSPNAAGICDMSGNVAEYVFVADKMGGNVRMGGSYLFPERYCELTGATTVPRGATAADLGFRVALVSADARDPDGRTLSMGTKSRILLRSGCAPLARRYLDAAMKIEGLSSEETEQLNKMWIEADLASGYQVGDWHGLMTNLTAVLERHGYPVREILRFWDLDRTDKGYAAECEVVRRLYSSHKVYGSMLDIAEVPKEVSQFFAPSLSKKVQALSCDFTGDGLMDLVVELAGRADASGEQYGFFEHLKGGGYRLVGEPIRTVGLCVLPHDGKQVLFLTMVKLSGDVLAPGVMDCTVTAGKPCLRIAWPLDRSYCLGELADEQVHRHAPFMGKRNAARVKHIAEGNYVRPLCWPWRR